MNTSIVPLPRLTVAIPTYNRRDYLRECLKSLQSQTLTAFEVVLFDNGSNYDVNELIVTFPQLSITAMKSETNIGAIGNFHRVLAYPFRTEYVIMFHDDDTLHPQYFEHAIAFLDTHPQAAWVGSNIRFMQPDMAAFMLSFEPCKVKSPFAEVNEQKLVTNLMDGFSLGFCSAVYRTDLFIVAKERHREFDKWLDRPFMIDIARGHTVGLSSFPFINYRIHPGQDSQHVEPEKLHYVVALFKYYRSKSPQRDTWGYKNRETTSALNTAFHVASTWREFIAVLKVMKKEDLFSIVNIRPKGVYYLVKFLCK